MAAWHGSTNLSSLSKPEAWLWEMPLSAIGRGDWIMVSHHDPDNGHFEQWLKVRHSERSDHTFIGVDDGNNRRMRLVLLSLEDGSQVSGEAADQAVCADQYLMGRYWSKAQHKLVSSSLWCRTDR